MRRATISVAIFAIILMLRAHVAIADAKIVTIEDRFGKVDVNIVQPSIVHLYLRGPNGSLESQSLLAQMPAVSEGPVEGGSMFRPWAREGYTYVVGPDGTRYESRLATPDKVDVEQQAGRTVVRISGVKLLASEGSQPVATEEWTLSATDDGSQLIWRIRRHWDGDFKCVLSGSPALFFSFNAPYIPNSTTTTIWYDPMRITARYDDIYDGIMNKIYRRRARSLSKNLVQTIKDRDTWAIFKLWTAWPATADLRLEVQGGHLYRRGKYAYLSEAGGVTTTDEVQNFRKGAVEEIALKMSPVDKQSTGYQLAVDVPDKKTEGALKDLYGSLFNGGTIADQKNFEFGNESDGYLAACSTVMHGVMLMAGVPAPGQLSSYPYDADRAFRQNIAAILTTIDDQDLTHYGFNNSGMFVDDNLDLITGTYAYMVHSGDLEFVRANLPVLERLLAYFTRHIGASGLFELQDPDNRWYYDIIKTSGINSYYNAVFYQALRELADMEDAAGSTQKADAYRKLAASIKAAFNRVLWKEDAPGGPRYIDWIDSDGKPVCYFCDLCQWRPIAVGIASPEQARKIIATADKRIAQLEKEDGYQGYATLSALWPIPDSANRMPSIQPWGMIMNGGSLLAETYWEVIARARAGDTEGAYRRLRLFAEHYQQTHWVPFNCFSIKAVPHCQEPYLADMGIVPAALVTGILGIEPTWNKLDVTPHLPAGWSKAEADILYKGQRQHVTIEHGKISIEPRSPVVVMPPVWEMDANLWQSPTETAKAKNIDFSDGGSIALKKIYNDHHAMALWKLDETNRPGLGDASSLVVDATPRHNDGDWVGDVKLGQPGHDAKSKAYFFGGTGAVAVPIGLGSCVLNSDRKVGPYAPLNDSLSFGPKESFTLQCWFKTESTANQTLLAQRAAYAMYVKNGRLCACLMQSGTELTEAIGEHNVSDGQWHHAAAVFDRQSQRLSLYLDGKLDVGAASHNPVDISIVGSSSIAPVSFGNNFVGFLDEVSIFRGALKPADFDFVHDYPDHYGNSKVEYPTSGTYQSPAHIWGKAVSLQNLTVAADLNGGQVTALVETSNNAFRSIQSQMRLDVKDGVNVYSLDSLSASACDTRIRFDLSPGNNSATTPAIDAFRIEGR